MCLLLRSSGLVAAAPPEIEPSFYNFGKYYQVADVIDHLQSCVHSVMLGVEPAKALIHHRINISYFHHRQHNFSNASQRWLTGSPVWRFVLQWAGRNPRSIIGNIPRQEVSLHTDTHRLHLRPVMASDVDDLYRNLWRSRDQYLQPRRTVPEYRLCGSCPAALARALANARIRKLGNINAQYP